MYTSYQSALEIFRASREDFFPKLSPIFVDTRQGTDAFDPCPVSVPEHFIPGPVFVALGSDHDCDGVSYHARKITASNLAEARKLAAEMNDIYDVKPLARDLFPEDRYRFNPESGETELAWSEYDYFMEEGYCSMGNDWYPWAGPDGDDSIGIPALDHTYDY